MKEQKVETLWSHLHGLSVLAQQGSYTAAAARLAAGTAGNGNGTTSTEAEEALAAAG